MFLSNRNLKGVNSRKVKRPHRHQIVGNLQIIELIITQLINHVFEK